MQLDIEIIDKFFDFAKYLGGGISTLDEVHPNLFVGGDFIHTKEYHLTKDELIFPFGHGVIAFGEPYPSKILSLEIGEPAIIREQIINVVLRTWHNAGDSDIPYSRKIVEETIRKETLNIIEELMTEIRGKVAGEYAGIKAELETQLSAKLGINQTTEEQHTINDTTTMNIDVPAWTSTSLNQKKSISDFRQTIKMKCELDASLRIDHGNQKSFPSLESFALYMKGGGGGTGESPMDKIAMERRFTNFEVPDMFFETERERLYKDVETSEITRKDLPIKKPKHRRRGRKGSKG